MVEKLSRSLVRAVVIILSVFKIVEQNCVAVFVVEYFVFELEVFKRLFKVVKVCVNLSVLTVVKSVVAKSINYVFAVLGFFPVFVEFFVKHVAVVVVVESVSGSSMFKQVLGVFRINQINIRNGVAAYFNPYAYRFVTVGCNGLVRAYETVVADLSFRISP